jgi:hypothetical protein
VRRNLRNSRKIQSRTGNDKDNLSYVISLSGSTNDKKKGTVSKKAPLVTLEDIHACAQLKKVAKVAWYTRQTSNTFDSSLNSINCQLLQ